MGRKGGMKWKFCVRMGIVNGKNEVRNKGEGRGIRREVVVCRVWMIVVRVFELVRWKDRIEE